MKRNRLSVTIDTSDIPALKQLLLSLYEIKREGAITLISPADTPTTDGKPLPLIEFDDWETLFSISDQLLPEISLSKVLRMSLYSPKSGANDIHFFGGGIGMFINRGMAYGSSAVSPVLQDSYWLRIRTEGIISENIGEKNINSSGINSSILYLPKGSFYSHQIPANNPITSISIRFTADFLKKKLLIDGEEILGKLHFSEGIKEETIFNRTVPVNSTMIQLSKMLLALPTDQISYPLQAESIAIGLLAQACNQLTTEKENDSILLRESDMERLDAVKGHIEEHFIEHHTQEQLAKWAGLNRRKLTEGFKSLYGVTIYDYLLSVRMQKAQQLLKESLPIGDVAELVGYLDHSSFSKAFKRYAGISPKDYR